MADEIAEPVGASWRIAFCPECGMKIPFYGQSARDEWANQHGESTGHGVLTWAEVDDR